VKDPFQIIIVSEQIMQQTEFYSQIGRRRVLQLGIKIEVLSSIPLSHMVQAAGACSRGNGGLRTCSRGMLD
jgi:hypothetical protein